MLTNTNAHSIDILNKKCVSVDKAKNKFESFQRGIAQYLQQNYNQTAIRLFAINKHSKNNGEILSKFKGKNKTFETCCTLKCPTHCPL